MGKHRYTLARRVRSIVRYAKATLAPTPTALELKRRALHEQLRREVTEAALVRAVEQAVRNG